MLQPPLQSQTKRESNEHGDGTKRSGREKMGPVFVEWSTGNWLVLNGKFERLPLEDSAWGGGSARTGKRRVPFSLDPSTHECCRFFCFYFPSDWYFFPVHQATNKGFLFVCLLACPSV